jgi:GTP-binding protein
MDLRNIAIIAHVDHGKTTLVDELLKQSGAFRENQAVAERAIDSNDLERERGITILAKATSLEWKGMRINIVDTPGHADFGGEVERILSMVDGVVLLVDAAEGPMPQTKFVTSKALALGLRPIVVLNKVDKPDAEPNRALDECFDLFGNLGADDDQLDFPAMYASGRSGWADMELDGPRENLDALFDLIVEHVPAPAQIARRDEPFTMLATTLGSDPFIGRILTGRVESGTLKAGETVKAIALDGTLIENFRATKILAFRGLSQQPIELAEAGDIVSLAGMSKATVADSIVAPSVNEGIPAQPIDPPTITVTFGINDSPLVGRDGKKVQSRVIRDHFDSTQGLGTVTGDSHIFNRRRDFSFLDQPAVFHRKGIVASPKLYLSISVRFTNDTALNGSDYFIFNVRPIFHESTGHTRHRRMPIRLASS